MHSIATKMVHVHVRAHSRAGEIFSYGSTRHNIEVQNEIVNIPRIRVTPTISARPSFLFVFSYFSDGTRGEDLDSRLISYPALPSSVFVTSLKVLQTVRPLPASYTVYSIYGYSQALVNIYATAPHAYICSCIRHTASRLRIASYPAVPAFFRFQ